MGFNSSGAVQGGMQGASAGASAGGGWGALIGGVLGAAGGSQLPQGQGALPPPPYLTGYGTPSGVSSEFGGSYVDPYTGRVVYTSPGGGDSSQMLQNMQYNSMLNQLLGIGGGDPMADLDAQIKEYQDKLANLGDYKGVVADKYFGKGMGSALVDEQGNLKDFNALVNAGFRNGQGRSYYGADGKPIDAPTNGMFGAPGSPGSNGRFINTAEAQFDMNNPLVKAFMAQYNGKYGEGGDIADAWYRFVKDAKNNFLDKQNQEYEQARRADEGNQAVRKEQAQAIQRQIDALTRAKGQYGQAGQGGGNSLLGYLTNAPNVQRMEIQKNLSDANSMANQRASRMGMSFSSQNELAKGGNAINAAVAMNNASRQNHQDTMSMMDWLRGGQAQAANQKVQNAQAQLGFTGQGYGLNTHQLDMEAQRQAAAAGLNTSYAFGQANLDSARQQAMMQGLGGIGQGLGSYYGSQSQAKQNPQQLGGTQESANNFGYKSVQGQ